MKTEPCLEDEVTGATYPLHEPRWRSDEGHSLRVSDLPGIGRDAIDRRCRSLWRYRSALPVDISTPVSLGEGCTPLIEGTFRGRRAWFKLEWVAPTGSFKDRGASVMISLLRQQGIRRILEDSSGNGGAAIAAYGAAAGLAVRVLAPAGTRTAKVAQMAAFGAVIELVPGTREETEARALELSTQEFYASHNRHPFFIQGTKTLGYELWEDLGFCAPDNVVIPTGAGSNVLGCDLAFRELATAGEIDRLPRLFAAQPANCAPIDAAFRAGADNCVACSFAPTIAEGTAIRRPVRMRAVLSAIRRSRGATVALEEAEIAAAAVDLARSGLFAEPTGATAAAALERLITDGTIAPDEITVVVLTGSGLKATGFFEETVGRDAVAGSPPA